MTLSDPLFFSGALLVVAGLVGGLRGDVRLVWGLHAVGYALLCLSSAADGFWIAAAIEGAYAAYCAYRWWRNRRNGRWKRAARELGEKSKARVQALVEQMTPSPIPSPAGAS